MSNVVFMGMGEPFHNWDAVKKSIEILRHPTGAAMSPRRLTVSTCGIPDGICRMAAEGPEVRLAVSLVTADPRGRGLLMPAAVAHPLDQLKAALVEYQRRRKRRITLEMVLISGRTDREQDVEALLRFIPPLSVMVNLIPWNPVPGMGFSEPPPERVQWYANRLAREGIVVTRRLGKGRGVGGACGQLAVCENGADPSNP